MKKILVLLFVGLFMVVSAQADEPEPGDLGSHECRLVQLEAQAAVEAACHIKIMAKWSVLRQGW